MPNLQVGGQIVQFLAGQGFPIPSPAVVARIGDRFRNAVRRLADTEHIPVVRFAKHARKLDVMRPHLDRQAATGRSGQLTTDHVVLAAEGLAVSERTVWRWIAAARESGELEPRHKGRYVVTEPVRARLAFWRGNVAALHPGVGRGGRVRWSARAEPTDAAARRRAGRASR